MSEPTEITLAECPCPGTPHRDGDTIRLKPEPDVPLFVAFGITFASIEGDALSIDQYQADMRAGLAALYLRHGIASWTFEDERGDPVPIKPSTVARLLSWRKGGELVAEAADRLYSDILFAPFVEALEKLKAERDLQRQTSASSPTSPTAKSTRRTRSTGSALRVVSPPSSPGASDGRQSEVRAS